MTIQEVLRKENDGKEFWLCDTYDKHKIRVKVNWDGYVRMYAVAKSPLVLTDSVVNANYEPVEQPVKTYLYAELPLSAIDEARESALNYAFKHDWRFTADGTLVEPKP